jgi:hypothetical protein
VIWENVMVRERMSVAEVLGARIPRLEWLDPGHGHWHSRVGPARLALEPDEKSFWLLLEGTCTAISDPDPLGASCRWPWPFKAIRRGSGGPWAWCAELWLDGRPEDAPRLEHLLDRLDRWLLSVHRGEDRRSRYSDKAESLTADARILVEAFGDDLRPSGAGYRLPMPDGPTLEFRVDDENHGAGWRVLGVLARFPEPLPPASLASVRDYLGIANTRFRGCRAFLDPDLEHAAILEGRLPSSAKTPETIREAVVALAEAGRLLAPACQVLYEVPKIGEAYVGFLLAGKVVRARAGEMKRSVPTKETKHGKHEPG